MNREISAGLVVFRKTKDAPRFLLLYHGGRYWNFPKGRIEAEERSFETALRETAEETNLKKRDLRIQGGFRAYENFVFSRRGGKTFKTVIFYLAETSKKLVLVSTKEKRGGERHEGFGWFLYKDALRVLEGYRDSQRVLKKANQFIRRRYYSEASHGEET